MDICICRRARQVVKLHGRLQSGGETTHLQYSSTPFKSVIQKTYRVHIYICVLSPPAKKQGRLTQDKISLRVPCVATYRSGDRGRKHKYKSTQDFMLSLVYLARRVEDVQCSPSEKQSLSICAFYLAESKCKVPVIFYDAGHRRLPGLDFQKRSFSFDQTSYGIRLVADYAETPQVIEVFICT